MPFTLISVWFDDWIFGTFACGLVCFLNYCFIIVSMWTLALISIDRHLYCIYPFRYQEIMSHRRALFLTVLSWGLGFLFGSLPSFINVVIYDHAEIICAVNWEANPVKVLSFTLSAFIICFMTPMVVMLYCYQGLYRVAQRHAKQMKERCGGQNVADSAVSEFMDNTVQYIENVPTDTKEREKRNEKVRQRRTTNNSKAIRSICIMFAAYLICNTPFSVTKLLKCVFSNNNVVPFYVNTAASWIAFTNPCCNPVIYSIYREDFKTAVRKMLPSIFSRKSNMQVRPFENKRSEVRTVVAPSEMNMYATPSESSSHSKVPAASLDTGEVNGQQPMIIITPPLLERVWESRLSIWTKVWRTEKKVT